MQVSVLADGSKKAQEQQLDLLLENATQAVVRSSLLPSTAHLPSSGRPPRRTEPVIGSVASRPRALASIVVSRLGVVIIHASCGLAGTVSVEEERGVVQ